MISCRAAGQSVWHVAAIVGSVASIRSAYRWLAIFPENFYKGLFFMRSTTIRSHARLCVIIGGILIALVTASASTALANVLQNGSFETGLLPTPPGTTLTAGSTAIDGWVVGGHGIDYIGTYWQAADGGRSVDLDSGTILGPGPYDGSLSQTFTTTIGQEYLLSFEMAGNPDGGPSLKTVRVAVAGGITDFSFLNSGQSRTDMGYGPRSLHFFATTASTTLTFTSLSGTGYGPVIDNASVTAVPEPATALLACASLAILFSIDRIKRAVTVAKAR